MKTPDEIIEAYPDAYWAGWRFMQSMSEAIAALERGEPDAAETNPSCNPWTVGCPS